MPARTVNRLVIDETVIKGDYKIVHDYAPEEAAGSKRPSVFTAVEEQLDLKLAPVEMLLIDHVERAAADN